MSEDELAQYAHGCMDALCTTSLRDLDDFLLPESHDVVWAELHRASATEEKRSHRAMKATQEQQQLTPSQQHQPQQKPPHRCFKWPERHASAFHKQGNDWCSQSFPSDAFLQSHPGLYRLTERHFDLAAIKGVTFPETRKACVELSQAQRGNTDGYGFTVDRQTLSSLAAFSSSCIVTVA